MIKLMDSNLKKTISIVYMVAGISSRFGGKVKQFAQVGKNNETLIELSLNQALEAGFNKIKYYSDLNKSKFLQRTSKDLVVTAVK